MILMKDKLEKTGHKKLYYRAKSVFTASLIALGVLGVAAIPVGISYQLAQAKERELEDYSYQDENLVEEENELLSYKNNESSKS